MKSEIIWTKNSFLDKNSIQSYQSTTNRTGTVSIRLYTWMTTAEAIKDMLNFLIEKVGVFLVLDILMYFQVLLNYR